MNKNMLIIAHRGNVFGSNPQRENTISYINEALNFGFCVEVDVWYDADTDFLWLGHDSPQYKITCDFLKNDKIWCHAKNRSALEYMIANNIHCFWHETDKYTITNKGYIWCYSGNYSRLGVTVDLTDSVGFLGKDIFGICTDIPNKWKEFLTNDK